MVEPHFSMLWPEEISHPPRDRRAGPHHRGDDDCRRPGGPRASRCTTALVGRRPQHDVALWHVVLDPGATWEMPAARADETVRVLDRFEGDGLDVRDANGQGRNLGRSTAAVVDSPRNLRLTAAESGIELLVIQGRPIGEPVAQHGPFVIDTKAEIVQAFEEYQRTQFGGWPWDRDDPVQGTSTNRFARHADGRVEEAVPA